MQTHEMKLSPTTLMILKNFAGINNSMAFEAGKVIRTINAAGSIFAIATIEEEFPLPFAVYELNKFIGVMNLPTLRNASLVFSDDKKVTIKGDSAQVDYYFTEASFAKPPTSNIVIPSVDLEFQYQEQDMEGFMKACSALGHKIMTIKVEMGGVYLIGTNLDIDNPNNYRVQVGSVEDPTIKADYHIKLENLHIIPGNYKVDVCNRGIAQFASMDRELTYFVGIERV